MDKWLQKIKKERRIRDYHIDKMNKCDSYFIERVVEKYRSDQYVDRWYRRGIEPPETLSFLLYEVAEKFGIETTPTSDFAVGSFLYKGYRFELLMGQGSCVRICKIKN